MMRNLAIGLGAALWGTLVFLLALQVHFPSELAIERAQWEVQEQSKGKWAIEAEDAGIWRLSGAHLDDLVLFSITKGRRGAPDTSTPVFRLDEARARLRLLPLLTGTVDAMAELRLFGGRIMGNIRRGSDLVEISAEGEDLDLSLMPLDGEEFTVEATGLASLDLELTLTEGEDPSREGTLALEIEDLVLQGVSVGGIDLPSATFTESILEVELDGDKASIQEGRFISDVVEIELDGDLTLTGSTMNRWRVKIEAEVNLMGELEKLSTFMPQQMKLAQDDDGTFHFVCTGTLSNPRCRPNRAKTRTRTSRTTTTRPTAEVDEDAEAEALRADRTARIQERRDRMEERRDAARAAEELDEEEIEFEDEEEDEPEEQDQREEHDERDFEPDEVFPFDEE